MNDRWKERNSAVLAAARERIAVTPAPHTFEQAIEIRLMLLGYSREEGARLADKERLLRIAARSEPSEETPHGV